MTKEAEDAQRRALGLPEECDPRRDNRLRSRPTTNSSFPSWQPNGRICDVRRPFVGGLTLELPADADDEVSSWIAAGTPPIYFGFGSSVRVAFPADTLTMISEACAQLGERALICSGSSDFTNVPHSDHVKVVGTVNHSAVFPACRAVVHHGGPGTTFAGIRAGVPTLALSVSVDQPMWAAAVSQLEVGFGRPFFDSTQETLSRICGRSSHRAASLEPARSPPRWPRLPKALPPPPISWKRRAASGAWADRRR